MNFVIETCIYNIPDKTYQADNDVQEPLAEVQVSLYSSPDIHLRQSIAQQTNFTIGCWERSLNAQKNELTITHIFGRRFYFTLIWHNHLLLYIPPPPRGSRDDTSRHAPWLHPSFHPVCLWGSGAGGLACHMLCLISCRGSFACSGAGKAC